MTKNNPFYYTLPVQPSDFIGRWPLVKKISADLCGPRADSWAIIGGRRFGKSSVLKAIELQLIKQLVNCSKGDRHIFPLIVDIKGSATETERNVYGRIVKLLYKLFHRRDIFEVDLPAVCFGNVGKSEVISFFQLEDVLENLIDYFEKEFGPLRLVLLLDELETITPFRWCETLFNNLRALIYDGPLSNSVKLVLTGSTRVIQVRHTGSPLLNMVKIEHIKSFSSTDMEKLITRDGTISKEVGRAVKDQSGGHPFIAQYLLHHLWKKNTGLKNTTLVQVEQIAKKMRQARTTDLRGWWEAIGEGGQRAYAVLTKANKWIEEQTLLTQIRSITQQPDLEIEALCYHGLVKYDPSGQQYRAVGKLFHDWFLQNVDQIQDSKKNRADELALHSKHRATVNIPIELIEELQKDNVVLFCGAGISMSEGALPSGGQLAHELVKRAKLRSMRGKSLPEVAQKYERKLGHQNLINYIARRIEEIDCSPQRAHHLIAMLPFRRIITTNWDNLLEDALRDAHKPFVKLVRDSDVAFVDEKKTLLIKLHGTIEQKDTPIITGDDYYDAFRRLPETANLVRSYFATKTLLFLGFSLADEDFRRMYQEVVQHLGKQKRRAYAVQLDPLKLTVKDWEQKNVQIITADVTLFLDALQKKVEHQ